MDIFYSSAFWIFAFEDAFLGKRVTARITDESEKVNIGTVPPKTQPSSDENTKR